jgi:hypothetical protein
LRISICCSLELETVNIFLTVRLETRAYLNHRYKNDIAADAADGKNYSRLRLKLMNTTAVRNEREQA